MHPTPRSVCTAAATLVAVGALASSAAAHPAPPACGDVVTTDTTLTADLVGCPGDGLVVGADDITIDLAGHRISGSGASTSRSGVDNEGHRGVTVRGGTISGFAAGVRAYRAADGLVSDLRVTGTINAVNLDGTSGLRVSGNRLTDNRTGVQVRDAHDTDVRSNVVRGSSTTGISDRGSTGSSYSSNTVVGNAHDGLALTEVAGAVVRDSTFLRNGLDGLRVDGESPGLRVEAVTASHNDEHGIVLSSTAPRVAVSRADHNGGTGIWAPDDVVDGGGSTARRNGGSQCLGIACG